MAVQNSQIFLYVSFSDSSRWYTLFFLASEKLFQGIYVLFFKSVN